MSAVKFLHISDIHLDSKINGMDSKKRGIRRTEIQMSLKNALDRFPDTDLVFIVGDLFDGLYNNLTVTYLCKLFESYPQVKFFAVCGNHDYLGSRPMDELMAKKSSNLVIFGDTISHIFLENHGICIYGASFCAPHMYSSLLSGFKVQNPDMVNIMLMHGEMEGNGKYNPVSEADIEKSGLDYLALGHTHTFSGIKKCGKTLYAYSGIPEPRGFDECGSCGIIYGSIDNSRISADFYPICKRKYLNLQIDITDCVSDAEVLNKINNAVLPENIYKITLTGTKKNDYFPNIQVLCEMSDSFYCEISDESSFETDIYCYIGENSLRGASAQRLLLAKESGKYDSETIDAAAEILCRLLVTSENRVKEHKDGYKL